MTVLLTIYNNIVQWMEAHMLSCPSRKYLHIECPGCGLQRSFIALLRGNFSLSFQLYPATTFLILLVGFTFLHLRFRYSWGAVVIKYLQLTVAIVIAVFYIYKIVNHKIIV